MRPIASLVAWFALASSAFCDGTHQWTSLKGTTITASFVSLDKNTLKLKTAEGKPLTATLASLSPESRELAKRLDRAAKPILVANQALRVFESDISFGKMLQGMGEAEGWHYRWEEVQDEYDPFGADAGTLKSLLNSWTDAPRDRVLVLGSSYIVPPDPEMIRHHVDSILELHKTGEKSGYRTIVVEPARTDGHEGLTSAQAHQALDGMAKDLDGLRVMPTRKVAAALSERFAIWKDGIGNLDDASFIQCAMLHSELTGCPADLAGMKRKHGPKDGNLTTRERSERGLPLWPTLTDDELTEMAGIVLRNLK